MIFGEKIEPFLAPSIRIPTDLYLCLQHDVLGITEKREIATKEGSNYFQLDS